MMGFVQNIITIRNSNNDRMNLKTTFIGVGITCCGVGLLFKGVKNWKDRKENPKLIRTYIINGIFCLIMGIIVTLKGYMGWEIYG